jgi:tight adherence protein C
LAVCLPLLWKQQRLREGKRQVQQEIAQLVEDLRLYLAFASTPGAALRLVIADAPEGILWTQLRWQRDTVLVEGPETALENVSVALNVSTLRRLVTRVKAAQAGSTALSAALQAATEELTQDLRREMEEQVEAAPTRLLIPMLVMLLVPLLIIVLTPPVQTLLDTLAGVGPTPWGG